MTTLKTPVRLRKRLMPSGNTSLYLDIYINGHRRLEYLRLYLIPEHNRDDKRKNADTMRLAEAIRAKRVVEVQNGVYGFSRVTEERLLDAIKYKISKIAKDSTRNMWKSALRQICRYEKNESITLAEIDRAWVEGFVEHLNSAYSMNNKRKPLADNTKKQYYTLLRSIFNNARKNGVIQSNPFDGVENFKASTSERQYLTLEELRTLSATKMPAAYDATRRAFLFSCLTGLRWSDISRLRRSDVHQHGDYTRIMFTQQKTGGREYLDISAQAARIIDECPGKDYIFSDLRILTNENKRLRSWVEAAGINKHISFHCARHTFAVMMLDIGTDIYTVSKLLGHADISTTQIYAKILDRKKREAVDAIPDILG